MMDQAAHFAHLTTGLTTVCRAWLVERTDGQTFGFTDHDLNLEFDGHVFRADTGLTALALHQSTGMAVDNTEAIGALSDASISQKDLSEGRFDGASVTAWSVNWANVEQRRILFRGKLGQIEFRAGEYRAEVRGLSEALNTPTGKFYSSLCSARLGDSACGVNVHSADISLTGSITVLEAGFSFEMTSEVGFPDTWFERGRVSFLTGEAAPMVAVVKRDKVIGNTRKFELWERPKAEFRTGDTVRVEAGCDKSFKTCRTKFSNAENFRGFPDIPGSDWLLAYPSRAGILTGGSRR